MTMPNAPIVKPERTPEYLHEIVEKTLLKKVESPRAYIIIIVAYMEELVTKIVKAHLAVPGGSDDNLFGSQAPLYNFGAKLRLAHRMGLISNEMYWLLDRLRKMRDKCAHSHTEISFSEPSMKDQIVEMYNRLSDSYKANSAADKFQQTVSLVLLALWAEYAEYKPSNLRAPKETFFR